MAAAPIFIKRDKIVQLTKDMIQWRDRAHDNYTRANAIVAGYVEKARQRGESIPIAEMRATEDIRWANAVSANQMYDRFATRDATVLTALASLSTAGLLEVRPSAHTHRASCHGEAGELICDG